MSSVAVNTLRTFACRAMLNLASGIYVAMGHGDVAWDTTPVDAGADDIDLVAEHGRRRALQVSYATPDQAGTIIVNTGSYSLSVTPTPFLYVMGSFAFTDAVGQTIREVGVFADTQLNSGIDPSGYIVPGQLANKGLLLVSDRFTSFERVDTNRQIFEYVIELVSA